MDSTRSGSTFSDLFADLQDSKQETQEQDPAPPEVSNIFSSDTKNYKKRCRDEYLANSADAPPFPSNAAFLSRKAHLFSKKGLIAATSGRNRHETRMKRPHNGIWLENHEHGDQDLTRSSRADRRMMGPFVRSYDSGVEMGKNDRQDAVSQTVGDVESERLSRKAKLRQALEEKALQVTEDPGDNEGAVFPYWQKQPDDLKNFHLKQEEAQRRVSSSIKKSGEFIDLSNMDLEQIRTPTLQRLRYHTRARRRVYTGGRKYRIHYLTLALRLSLSNNSLGEVPGEVFHLKNLEVLSLRSNNLTEILPSIGELKNLRELDLASNQLKWLPWELFSLLHANLWKCQIYPNPFIRPIPSTWENAYRAYKARVGIKGGLHRNCKHPRAFMPSKPKLIASTRVAFLDIIGASFRYWPPAPSSVLEHWPKPQADDEFLRPHGPLLEERTKTPSLLELVLRACKDSPQLSQLPFLIPDDFPEHLTHLLQKTWRLKEAGGQRCSVCGDEYIVPRTEWVEWWYCIKRAPVPFLRRGCSWQCWEENTSSVVRGWSSAPLPGGLYEGGYDSHFHTA